MFQPDSVNNVLYSGKTIYFNAQEEALQPIARHFSKRIYGIVYLR